MVVQLIGLTADFIGFIASLATVYVVYNIIFRTKKGLRRTFFYFLATGITYAVIKLTRVFGRLYFGDNVYYMIAIALMNILFSVLFLLGIIAFYALIKKVCTVKSHPHHKR